jgi:hypothetical protein
MAKTAGVVNPKTKKAVSHKSIASSAPNYGDGALEVFTYDEFLSQVSGNGKLVAQAKGPLEFKFSENVDREYFDIDGEYFQADRPDKIIYKLNESIENGCLSMLVRHQKK